MIIRSKTVFKHILHRVIRYISNKINSTTTLIFKTDVYNGIDVTIALLVKKTVTISKPVTKTSLRSLVQFFLVSKIHTLTF